MAGTFLLAVPRPIPSSLPVKYLNLKKLEIAAYIVVVVASSKSSNQPMPSLENE
jgi:hypothetical protein